MWGNIFVDYSLHRNFNIGFSGHKNNIHLHLSQWQYWWWFWFSLLWALYFLVIIRTWISKTENFNITANTSLRSHGKWGDFLVALIPLSWCGNILINSNFILRMIEWQNESSIFTIRVQGKQWYWVYKYNSDINYKLSNIYYSVGNNNWFKPSSLSYLYFNYENSIMSYIHDKEYKNYFTKSFYKSKIEKEVLDKIHYNTQLDNINLENISESSKININLLRKPEINDKYKNINNILRMIDLKNVFKEKKIFKYKTGYEYLQSMIKNKSIIKNVTTNIKLENYKIFSYKKIFRDTTISKNLLKKWIKKTHPFIVFNKKIFDIYKKPDTLFNIPFLNESNSKINQTSLINDFNNFFKKERFNYKIINPALFKTLIKKNSYFTNFNKKIYNINPISNIPFLNKSSFKINQINIIDIFKNFSQKQLFNYKTITKNYLFINFDKKNVNVYNINTIRDILHLNKFNFKINKLNITNSFEYFLKKKLFNYEIINQDLLKKWIREDYPFIYFKKKKNDPYSISNIFNIQILNKSNFKKNLTDLLNDWNYFKRKKEIIFKITDQELLKGWVREHYPFIRFNRDYFDIYEINNTIFNTPVLNKSYFEINQINMIDESDYVVRLQNKNFPVKLVKGILNKQNLSNLNTVNIKKKNIFLNYKLNSNNISSKVAHAEHFWGFRQKRYKKVRSYSFVNINKYNNKTYNFIESFNNNKILKKYNLYNSLKTTRGKNELIPSTIAKRLLRTKRTLVLPAHINITLITGSYDVVHSWFIPGLGLKMDCVPGRSTHHSLYIDNIGFYYGQCAEICGRYHHHMPIRICALNYNQFLLWWHTRGLHRMYRSKSFLKRKSILATKFKN